MRELLVVKISEFRGHAALLEEGHVTLRCAEHTVSVSPKGLDPTRVVHLGVFCVSIIRQPDNMEVVEAVNTFSMTKCLLVQSCVGPMQMERTTTLIS